MNIVVIGGGTPGHFGSDFCARARSQGHNLAQLSHKNHNTGHPQDYYADCAHTTAMSLKALDRMTDCMGNIDLFLFNTVAGAGPWNPEDFTTKSRRFSEREWLFNLRVNVILPYDLTIRALAKMNSQSKIVYMTTGRSMNVNDDSPPFIASYYGAKAWANHVMKSFAVDNDRGATVLSLTTHFDYGNPEAYWPVFDRAYEFIMQGIDHELHNGQVISI